jgi:acetyltransferase-like isoleucine patch superfamily enzyme
MFFDFEKLSWKINIKCFIYQKILRINSNVKWPVSPTSTFKKPEKIIRGNRFPGLSKYCYLDARNGIEFGSNVWVGPSASLVSMNHDPNNYSKYFTDSPIRIGNNCWLGSRSIILPGVQLGNHVIVAAGAVVNKSFEEDNIIIAGVPARIVKRISEYEG